MAINVLCVCWRIRRKGTFRTLCIHRLSCWSAFAFELSCQRTPLPPCICKCLVKMPQNLKKSKVWCGFVSVCTISLLNASIISVGRLAPVLWKCFCKSDLREHFQRNKMIPKSHIEDYKPTITSSNIHENKKKRFLFHDLFFPFWCAAKMTLLYRPISFASSMMMVDLVWPGKLAKAR